MKRKDRFWEYILFNKEAFNVLSAMSFIFAFIFCGAMTALGIIFKIWTLAVMFGIFTLLSIRNLYTKRIMIIGVFKSALNKSDEAYIDLTVADTLNTNFGRKECKPGCLCDKCMDKMEKDLTKKSESEEE